MKLNPTIAWIVAIGLICTVLYYIRNPLSATVTIRNKEYIVEVAATPEEKELGLGNRDALAKNHGMLFPYDHTEAFSYWMKGMRFPIDIIWIRDTMIVDITKNVPVSTTVPLPVYGPRVPVNKVLELNAGEVDEFEFQIGDTVYIKN